MKLSVSASVSELCPKVIVGVVRAEGLTVRAPSDDVAGRMLEEEVTRLRARFSDQAALDGVSTITGWRATYARLGTKVRSYRPTHDALARRYLKGAEIFRVNAIVDTYLANQLAHLLPHGGYDLDRLEGDLVLDRSPGGEPFVPMGSEEERTEPGEVVYRDRSRVLTRRWNFRDCDHAKLVPETKRALLMLEAEDPSIDAGLVRSCVDDLVRRLRDVFDGSIEGRTSELTLSRPEAEI